MSCCPKGSWDKLNADYHPQGEDLIIEGAPIYHVGEGHRAIVIISDIFGAKSGRHRNVADIFASLKYNVFLPEILVTPYEGELGPGIGQNIKSQDQSKMTQTFGKVVSFLESKGIKQYFAIGFCWGVWQAFKLSAKYDGFIAIGGPHPSLGVETMIGGNQAELVSEVRCPAFFLPAENDPPNVKKNGQVVENLAKRFGADKTGTHEFPQMKHGWVVRGDLNDEKVARDVKEAIHLIHKYFQRFN